MPYNETLDTKIRKITSKWDHINIKKMFGGTCHLMNGNMVCGVYKDYLILRLGEEKTKHVLELPFVRPFDITGKPMKGWVMIENDGFKTDENLETWLNEAKGFVTTLPAK